jgi:hypothetical protein
VIDVWGVLANVLWVLGLAVLLASWSLAYDRAHRARRKVRAVLATPGYGLAVDLGMLLFVAGMAATEHRAWARVIWIVLGLAIAAQRVVTLVRLPSSNEVIDDDAAHDDVLDV